MSLFFEPEKSQGEKLFEKFLFILAGLLLAMFIVLATSAANAQQLVPAVKALQKGDAVPDLTLTNLVNIKDSTETIHLTSTDDRLTVLIFFGTWCSSCRAEFPSHQALQNRFKEKVRLIIVGSEPRAKLASYFNTARFTDGTSYTFPCVAEDKQLKSLFPHRLIPHLVWIKSGKVVATTDGEELTAENITTVLNGSAPPYQKKDIDAEKPLFFNDDLPPSAIFSLFIKGQVDGLGNGGRFRRSGDVVFGRLMHNSRLYEMYRHAASELLPGINSKRVLSTIKDSSGFFIPAQASPSERRKNYCTYEIRVPLKEADSLYAYMLKDLNRYTPYHGSIEKRRVKCLVMTVVPGYKDRLKTKGGTPELSFFPDQPPLMINYSTKILLLRLNDLKFLPLPVVDETGLTENIDLSLTSFPTSEAELKSALLKQGLKLSERERELEMLCLKDDK
ncbi:TlpA family protein disulfide reductase [Desertivirga brevis]|uniref:TlpA family protein disulfide reductase n=1 Tax=Desertivirga brevis TaxID=2810310 RepID=UPI001A976CAF|nr:TlpA disulfide reductase family protein [Pedobacter sp. SYSU D00873]